MIGGAAVKANELISSLDMTPLLVAADEDAEAYAALQRTWKEPDMPADEKSKIEARALAIPTNLVEVCHANIVRIKEFLPHCNPNITSDAKVVSS
jgi:formiminotetrahydrofolate cyclodeaminase